jgi:phosphate transport system substrate-binding protein
LLALAPGCGARREAPLTLKGSDTMILLGQRWAESYMAANPGRIVQVTGGGSGTGMAALINGTTEICQSSRPIKEAEKAQIESKYGRPPVETLVARDGIAIYAHESNPVDSLTLEQIHAIYAGELTNWKALGGPDAPIVLYGRENNSGTYEYFKEHVLETADFAAGVQTLPGTAAVVNAVAQEVKAIGYGGAAYAKGVKEIAIRKDESSPAVRPTKESVLSGAYPLSRGLYFYTRTAPEGRTRDFVDFVLSPPGQALVGEVGYYPLQ